MLLLHTVLVCDIFIIRGFMKKVKINALIISVLLLLTTLIGCLEQPKIFEKNGIRITATTAFNEIEFPNTTMCLESSNKLITALKETPTAEFHISKTLRQYSELVLQENNLVGTQIDFYNEGGIIFDFFTYEKNIDGTDFKYLGITKKSSSYFYLFNFICETKNYDRFANTFFEWVMLIVVE